MSIASRTGRLSRTLVGLFALSLAAAPAAVARAQGREAKAAPPDTAAVTPETIATGRALFHGSGGCHNCHGEKLEGTPVAPTLRAHKWRDAIDGTLPELYRVITRGVDGTAMVPRPGGVSDPQAAALASYVWAVNNRGAKP